MKYISILLLGGVLSIVTPKMVFSQLDIKIDDAPGIPKELPKKSTDIGRRDTLVSYKSFDEFLSNSSLMAKIHWSLSFEYQRETLLSNKEVVDNINNAISGKKLPAAEMKYTDQAKSIFGNLGLMGSDLGKFFNTDGRTPFAMLKFNIDKQPVLAIPGATSSDVFNTLKLTAKQRAQRVLSDKLLPAIKNIGESTLANLKGIKYLSLSFTYGSKNFIEKSNILNLKAEHLVVVFPVDLCKKFVANVITQEELLNGSHFYLSDRDSNSPNKITLTIE